jgi:hypothetical protein
MALYIKDKNVVNAASTKEGINLIIDFIKNKKDYDPTFDKIEEGMSGAVKKRILL